MAGGATVRETGLGMEAVLDIPMSLGTINSAVLKAMDIALTKGAYLIDAQVKKQLQQEISAGRKRPKFNSSTGQGRSGSSHYSIEGESPNTDTGRLVQSFGIPSTKNPLHKYVKTDVGYAKYLEPMPHGSRGLNRPFLNPAVDRVEKPLMMMIRKALNKSKKKKK